MELNDDQLQDVLRWSFSPWLAIPDVDGARGRLTLRLVRGDQFALFEVQPHAPLRHAQKLQEWIARARGTLESRGSRLEPLLPGLFANARAMAPADAD